MYNKEKDPELAEIIMSMNNISSTVLSTHPSVHSIYVYNNYNKTFYSTYKGLLYQDDCLNEVIASFDIVPKLVPILRKIEANDGRKNEYDDVFTYFLYGSIDANNMMDGAVIVNVKAKWLMDNVSALNALNNNDEEKVYIVSEKGEFITNKSIEKDDFDKLFIEHYSTSMNKSNLSKEQMGIYNDIIDGKNYTITYVYVDDAKLLLLKTQPSDKVYSYINNLKNNIILITIIFLFFTVLISLYISKGIYKPVSNLVRKVLTVSTYERDIHECKDEISFLENVYKSSANKLSTYENERHSYNSIVKAHWLKRLLTDSASINEKDFEDAREKQWITASPGQLFAVCIVKVDNFNEFKEEHDIDERELLKFAIINITSEILSDIFATDGVDVTDDHVALLVQIDENKEDFFDKMEERIMKAQEYIQKYYKISISASISNISRGYKELTKLYISALNNSVYRFVLGKGSVITPQKIRKNLENRKIDYAFSLEKKMTDAIKSGSIKNIEEALDKILAQYMDLSYNNILISLVHLIETIRNTVDEINKFRIDPIYVNFEQIIQDIFVMETIDEFRDNVITLISGYFQKDFNVDTNKRHAAIVETVCNYIEKNYYDNNLCLSNIANMVKMSTKHLGRIFKERMNMSIPEYINEIRLKKAAELLKKSDLNVYEITTKVGFSNETYFYSVFKKRFGITPKEYVLQNTIKRSNSVNA